MLRRYPVTVVATLAAVAIVLVAALGNFNIIPMDLPFLAGIEHNEVDDVVAGLGLVILALAVDRMVATHREVRAARIAAERRELLETTMKAVLEIVSDCLEQLEPLRHRPGSESAPGTPESVHRLIDETSARLKQLAGSTTAPATTVRGQGGR